MYLTGNATVLCPTILAVLQYTQTGAPSQCKSWHIILQSVTQVSQSSSQLTFNLIHVHILSTNNNEMAENCLVRSIQFAVDAVPFLANRSAGNTEASQSRQPSRNLRVN